MSLELTEKELERLTSVLSASSSSMLLHSKSESAQALARTTAHKRLVKELTELAGYTEDGAKALATKIQAEEKEAKFAEEKFKKERLREEKIVEGFKKTYEGLKQFAGGSVNSAQTLYNTESAFSAVIPTMNLLGDVVKNTMSAFSSFASGIPILGGIVQGFSNVANVAVDVTMKVMSMQLEAIQKSVNDFNTLSKAGLTFGGELHSLQQSAQNAGMGMHTYTKFVTSNIESLSKFQGSLENSASSVGIMSTRLRQTNPGLFSMYGNVSDFAGAVADYASTMAGYGIDVTKNTNYLNRGAREYLFNLKELSALTGKNAATLKKEEEARQKFAAYSLERGQLEGNQQANLDKAMASAVKFGGEAADKYAMEYFANKGQIISPEALMYQSNNQVATELIRNQIDLATKTKVTQAEFMKSQAEMVTTAFPAMLALAKERKPQDALTFAVKNPMLEMQNKADAAVIAASVAVSNAETVASTLIANRSQAEANDNLRTTGGATYGTTISRVADAAETYNINMDKLMMKRVDEAGLIVEKLIQINQKLFGNEFTQVVFDTAVDKFKSAIDLLLEKVGGGGSGSTTTTSSTTGSTISNILSNPVAAVNAASEEMQRRNREARAQTGTGPAVAGAVNQGGTGVALNIPVKNNEYSERAMPNEKLTRALNSLYDKFGKPGNWQVTAGNDLEHTSGDHTMGRAADIKVRGEETRKQAEDIAETMNEKAKAAGIKGKAEAHEDIDTTTGKGTGKYHIHYKLSAEELVSMVIEGQNRLVDSTDRVVASTERTGDLIEKLLRMA